MTEEEAIKAAMLDQDYIHFSGMNCMDWDDRVCEGWDGMSRRCECGNRRVGWYFYRDKDNNIVSAEAEAF